MGARAGVVVVVAVVYVLGVGGGDKGEGWW